jgi:hypothetical protein
VVASERYPLSAISLAEVLATSDVPKGVVNVLTGSPAEIAPWLASHADVNALDLVGGGALDWVDLEIAAADTLKRVLRPEQGPDAAAPTLDRIAAFTETKTVWHTKSLRGQARSEHSQPRPGPARVSRARVGPCASS